MSYYDLKATFVPIVAWPGERTKQPQRARFKSTTSATVKLLKRELRHLDARNIVVQLDCDESEIRQDGYPRSNARVRSPRMILTFDSRFGPLSYPCDRFTSWDDNLRAIALALEALRKVDRYGVTRRGEQYTGWKALPANATPMTAIEAAEIYARMGDGDVQKILSSRAYAGNVYKDAVKRAHPDVGGSANDFYMLQAARRIISAHFGTFA